MLETYKMFSNIRVAEYSGLTNEQLALAYQAEDLKPEILAEMYCRNYAILYRVSSKYFSINDADKASIITVDLNTTMQMYDESKSNKFITFALHSIIEKLNIEISAQNKQKRIPANNLISLNNTVDDMDKDIGDNYYFEDYCDDNNYDLVELQDVVAKAELTNKEKRVCYLYMENKYTKDEIADILNVTRQTVYHIISSLRLKLSNGINNF